MSISHCLQVKTKITPTSAQVQRFLEEMPSELYYCPSDFADIDRFLNAMKLPLFDVMYTGGYLDIFGPKNARGGGQRLIQELDISNVLAATARGVGLMLKQLMAGGI